MVSISIVVPFYNESDCVKYFFSTLEPIIETITKDYEIICIDDGSTDNTLYLLKEELKRNKNIRIISFSRNFGKEAALTAGLDIASKAVTIPIDADLQDPPELIPLLVKKWEEGYGRGAGTQEEASGQSYKENYW